MSDLVRARLTVGDEVIEKNVGRVHAEASGLEVLDEPTHNPDGTARLESRIRVRSGRPAKTQTTVSSEAAKQAVTKSASKKEESK